MALFSIKIITHCIMQHIVSKEKKKYYSNSVIYYARLYYARYCDIVYIHVIVTIISFMLLFCNFHLKLFYFLFFKQQYIKSIRTLLTFLYFQIEKFLKLFHINEYRKKKECML